MDKQCFKCGESKPIDEFYTHPRMGDGHLGKCKVCTRKDTADRNARLWKIPQWRALQRERGRNEQQRYRELGLAWKPTPETRRRWEAKNKHKKRAVTMANRAQKKGLILKPDSCQECGAKNVELEKHHPDYSKPLEVQWLCTKCHGVTRRKNDYVDIVP